MTDKARPPAFRAPLAVLVALVALAGLTGGLLLLGRRLYPAGARAGEVQRGEEVFWGRGRCATCHPLAGEGGGVRGPDLGREGSTFPERASRRVPGLGALEYLVQSLVDPEAYVVPGYPARLMPAADQPPVALSDEDLIALSAFLLADAGAAEGRPRDAAGAARAALGGMRARRPRAARVAGDPTAGRLVYDRMGCAACHVIAGVTEGSDAAAARRRGPDLTGIAAVQSEAYLEESVWQPDAVVVPGAQREWLSDDGHSSRMPSYREVMTRAELADLVAFLSLQR